MVDAVEPSDRRTDAAGAMAAGTSICLAVATLSWCTAIIESSPIHSDSWAPTLVLWGVAPGMAATRFLLGRRFARVWLLGGLGGPVLFVVSVFAFVFVEGT